MSATALNPRLSVTDPTTGLPLVGAEVFTFLAGTTTQLTTWSDPDKSVVNTNPVVTGATGEATIYFDQPMRFEVRRADGIGGLPGTLLSSEDRVLPNLTTTDVNALIQAARVGNLMVEYNTVADVSASTIPADVERIRVLGHTSARDRGGAEYVRAPSAPSHQMRLRSSDTFLPSGQTDPNNGGWWEIAEQVLRPEMAGGFITDPITTQTAAINRLNDANVPGRIIDLGGLDWQYSGALTIAEGRFFSDGSITIGGLPVSFRPVTSVTITPGSNGILTRSTSGTEQKPVISLDVRTATAAEISAGTEAGKVITPAELAAASIIPVTVSSIGALGFWRNPTPLPMTNGVFGVRYTNGTYSWAIITDPSGQSTVVDAGNPVGVVIKWTGNPSFGAVSLESGVLRQNNTGGAIGNEGGRVVRRGNYPDIDSSAMGNVVQTTNSNNPDEVADGEWYIDVRMIFANSA